MADGFKIDTVRSGSSGVLGRSLNSARHQHFVLDSPSGPNEAITNGEAFLAGISSCGVTLIEKHAHDTGVPLRSMEVMIEGIAKQRGAQPVPGHPRDVRDAQGGPGRRAG
jgi:uncharacterized OsmC-like protein